MWHLYWYVGPLTKQSPEKYPVARVCQACGSREFIEITASLRIGFGRDRECKACATRYTAPPSVGMGILLLFLGSLLAAPCGWLEGYWLLRLTGLIGNPTVTMYWSSLVCPTVGLTLGLWVMWVGLRGFGWRSSSVNRGE